MADMHAPTVMAMPSLPHPRQQVMLIHVHAGLQAVYQRMASEVASWWVRDSVAAEPLLMPMLLPGARMLHTGSAAALRARKYLHQSGHSTL